MKQRRIYPAPVLIIGVALFFANAHRSIGEAILIDDFADGNDDGWIHAPRTGGAVDFGVQAGAYRLQSVGAVTGPNGVTSYWEDSFDPKYANGYLRATVRSNNPSSNPLLLMRIGDTNLSETRKFYAFLGEPDVPFGPRIAILEFGSGPPAVLAEAPVDFTSGEDWIMEAGTVGDQLSFKVWRVSDTEPATPQLMVTDDTHASGGFALDVGVAPGVTVEPLDGTFDDIFFTVPGSDLDCNGDGAIEGVDLDCASAAGNRAQFDGILTEIGSLVGDLDFDGEVGFADFLKFSENFNTSSMLDVVVDSLE